MQQKGTILTRIAVGLIFLAQDILKFIDSHIGRERLTRIGFPHRAFVAHFVTFLGGNLWCFEN